MRRPPTSTSILAQQLRRSPACLSRATTDFASNSARIIQSNQNVLVVLDLIETESGSRVDIRPLWVDGPNAGARQLAEKNQHLVAQLLTLVGLPTAGNVGSSFRNWRGWSLMRASYSPPISRSGRTYNALAEIYVDDGP